ncbi:hypothetical protein QAD02_002754 [Eretmocerus hayati]|uniref:Uncharacterized protein n=1 Tax=Eretmocerus hayati TaxID=131215 RepID=A0ACC2NJY1_9HYME|nr:hypothetical protein QAD02_002754 [Eretmocerus hayati]
MQSLSSRLDVDNEQLHNDRPDDDLLNLDEHSGHTHDRDSHQTGNPRRAHQYSRELNREFENLQHAQAQHIEQRRLIDNELAPINDRLSSLVSQIQDLNTNFEGRSNIVENDNIVASRAIEHLQNGQRQTTGHIRQLTEANEHLLTTSRNLSTRQNTLEQRVATETARIDEDIRRIWNNTHDSPGSQRMQSAFTPKFKYELPRFSGEPSEKPMQFLSDFTSNIAAIEVTLKA